MSILDIAIIFIILFSAIMGAKRGFFKELVMTAGYIIVLIISWNLKNPLANILSFNLPFFEIGGLKAINIILYQFLAFIIIELLLLIIFHIVLRLVSGFEKFLNFTIILGIPSKILGFIVGALYGVVLAYFLCLILNWPIFMPFIKELPKSKLKSTILNGTPLLNKAGDTFNNAANDINHLLEKRDENGKIKTNDKDIINILLKNKVIDNKYIESLEKRGKI